MDDLLSCSIAFEQSFKCFPDMLGDDLVPCFVGMNLVFNLVLKKLLQILFIQIMPFQTLDFLLMK